MQRPRGSQAPKSVEQGAKPLVNQTELWEIRPVTRYRYPRIDAMLFVNPLGPVVASSGPWPGWWPDSGGLSNRSSLVCSVYLKGCRASACKIGAEKPPYRRLPQEIVPSPFPVGSTDYTQLIELAGQGPRFGESWSRLW